MPSPRLLDFQRPVGSCPWPLSLFLACLSPNVSQSLSPGSKSPQSYIMSRGRGVAVGRGLGEEAAEERTQSSNGRQGFGG